MDFTGKAAIITGGANGIGRAVAQGVVDGGGAVAIADIDEEAARALQRELGGKALVYALDVGDPACIRETFSRIISDFGKIDILVNSAAIVSTAAFGDLGDAEWERVVRTNLTGTFTACSVIFNHMKGSGGGSIVNIASVAGKVGGGLLGTAAYASSKAGVIGLSKAVAREGGPFGIRCNVVCPAYTQTGMTRAITDDAALTGRVLGMIPLGRAAQPLEIANLVLFFASGLASFATGAVVNADGGLTRDG